MRTLGLVGGMSWESTATYYRLVNQGVKQRLGGHHSAKMILYSVDFAEVEALQRANRWDEAGALLGDAARQVERAGAEALVLCTNTMHRVAPQIEASIAIPLLHIADGTGAAIREAGVRKVGLLGTRFTMEHDFYAGHLRSRWNLDVIAPPVADRDEVHRVIYEELTHGVVRDGSRATYLAVIERLGRQGAEGIILGCTEISMLVDSSMIALPCFDTTDLHARSAVDFALGDGSSPGLRLEST